MTDTRIPPMEQETAVERMVREGGPQLVVKNVMTLLKAFPLTEVPQGYLVSGNMWAEAEMQLTQMLAAVSPEAPRATPLTDYEIVDRLFAPNDLKGLGVFVAFGGPEELREWLRERIAPKVEELLRVAAGAAR